ncbi:MAG: hypothetical protein ABL899_02600 [Nitrospira sp.]
MIKSSAMDYWFSVVHLGNTSPEFIHSMFASLHDERPPILSVVGERACNLQCHHCIFQAERSSNEMSLSNSLITAVKTIVIQMGANPIVVHEGRIFRPEHLEWLTAIREVRPDARIGMIDSGAYLNHAKQIEQSGFKFDWLDISLDGDRARHNLQRDDYDAFNVAIEGITNAKRFLTPRGYVTSLFTLTRFNQRIIAETEASLPKEITEWHITTLSPARPEINWLSVETRDFPRVWSQIVSVNKIRPVFVRVYVAEDILKLARAVGKEKFLSALQVGEVSNCSITLNLDGVSVTYYPQSVATSETFVIDADAHYRAPYSVAYTLEELRSGVSRFGEDLRDYTIGKVDQNSQFAILYDRDVELWANGFGRKALNKEISVFRQISKL